MLSNQFYNKGTILIIDDDKLSCSLLQALVEKSLPDYTVLQAHDGLAGLALYRHYQAEIRLVLLDRDIPRMNGVQIFYALQQCNPQVRCLMISGLARQAEISRLQSHGLLGFLEKPISISNFVRKTKAAVALEHAPA